MESMVAGALGGRITLAAGALVQHLAVVGDQYGLAGDAVAFAVGLQLGIQLGREVVGSTARRNGQGGHQEAGKCNGKSAMHRSGPSAVMAHLGM